MNLVFKVSIIGVVLFFLHVLLNYILSITIEFKLICVLQLFYSASLLFSCLYVVKKNREDKEKLWVAYLTVVSVKFFLTLGFIYFIKSFFGIEKTEALVHIFLWFFIYLFFEVKIIMKEVKKA